MERIRVETEKRVSRRRELLDQELHEYNAAIELEVQRVEKRVGSFEEEVAAFFEQLLQEADPTIFASMAAQMPDPPAFTEIANGALTAELRARREQIMRTDVALPDFDSNGSNGSRADAKHAPDNGEAPARQAAAPKPAGRESTQVVVVGLVSVASIATFKRQLGRLPGVKSVGVSSGPDGEFIFTIGHTADTSLSTLIPTLPAFQARVVNEHDGVLNVSAHDPEAEG
jgi:hypothetical protein